MSTIMNRLEKALGISENELVRIIRRSPHTYKTYVIPKKSKGFRKISQPAKETKFIQHWIIDNIFNMLPIHDCATAYNIGASIKKNASIHQNNEYIVKFDFKNFFPSIKEKDLINHLSKHIMSLNCDDDDIKYICRISCIKRDGDNELCLSIGAPSSPVLSNSVMFEFDQRVFEWCNEKKVIYTRYADDLTFSTNVKNISSEIELMLELVLSEIYYPKLSLNKDKTIHLSKKNCRRITGLIINNDGALSLGRERKRRISVLVHKFTLNCLLSEDVLKLRGLLAFAKDIEPMFFLKMEEKYGKLTINKIFSMKIE